MLGSINDVRGEMLGSINDVSVGVRGGVERGGGLGLILLGAIIASTIRVVRAG